MIDLQTDRNVYASFALIKVALIRLELNLADALIKLETNSILLESITAKKLVHSFGQWIIPARIKELLVD